MKKFPIFLALLSLSFQASAYQNTFKCNGSKNILWSTISSFTYKYDSITQVSTLFMSIDGKRLALSGTTDTRYNNSKAPDSYRFLNVKDGTSAFDDLTSESYTCQIVASKSLTALGSKGGNIRLTCRGEGFELGTYVCQ